MESESAKADTGKKAFVDMGMEVYPVEYRNSIKYTRLPDFDSRASWCKNSYILPPRLRRIIDINDELTTTSRSYGFESVSIGAQFTQRSILKNPIARPEETSRKPVSSSRKFVTISEEEEQEEIKRKGSKKQAMKTEPQKELRKEGKKSLKPPSLKSSRNVKLTDKKYEPHKEKKPNSPNSFRKSSNLAQLFNPAGSVDVKPKGKVSDLKTKSNRNKIDIERTEIVNEIKNKLTSRNKTQPVTKIVPDKSLYKASLTNPERLNDVKKNKRYDAIHVPIETERIIKYKKEAKPQKKNVDHVRFSAKPSDDDINRSAPLLLKIDYDSTNTKIVDTSSGDTNSDTRIRDYDESNIVNYNVIKTSAADSHGSDNYGSANRVLDESTRIALEDCNKRRTCIVDQCTETSKCDLELKDNFTEIDINSSEDKSTEVEKIHFVGIDRGENVAGIDSADFENILNDINLDDPHNHNHDNLNVPNVSLLKQKIEVISHSLPNIPAPVGAAVSDKNKNAKKIKNTSSSTSSYFIRRATLTYTTKKKIDFHVYEKNDKVENHIPLAHPLNVVSVFRNEMKKNETHRVPSSHFVKKNNQSQRQDSTFDVKSNFLPDLDCSPLIKPSEIIRTMKVNNNITDPHCECEQFQRELNFIDSFFESLQFLENSSLSNKNLNENSLENWVSNSNYNLGNQELSKLETEESKEETARMASRSLCLLNLLIRDEQRRAKNLMLVLKMREDALKDFTKSHIIWLENKKKQDNTEITVSTLKKKQRGALLKLQHECGEMQRMRKALLALTEKRKLALMKTKKSIELKLKNNINAHQIPIEKKKIKRNMPMDRSVAPLKCFDFSSSGCDEGNISQVKSDSTVLQEVSAVVAEKSIQTIDTGTDGIKFQENEISAQDFVTVDGSYLNILFQNLSLPQIFSVTKSYEVNEEALKNIVNSTTIRHRDVKASEIVEKFMEQIKSHELDKSNQSSPSTARSLVEELDQYYKDVLQESRPQSPDPDKSSLNNEGEDLRCLRKNADTSVAKSLYESDLGSISQVGGSLVARLSGGHYPAPGPLPVPDGAFTDNESVTGSFVSAKSEVSAAVLVNSSMIEPICGIVGAAPALCEAEELRRQQLAIEREIKALEQQQKELLAVREIPDKPPPPYTPPAAGRAPRPANTLLVDNVTEYQIYKIITEDEPHDIQSNDAFELFVNDFCQENIKKNKNQQSDMPWDSCNLLPQKPQISGEQLARKTSQELKEILSGTKPTVVSGVSARRSDHIDDILFTEWHRCEPEWTKLHVDEADVKNQLFEKIFEKILDETIVEYKDIVPNTSDIEA